MHLSSDLDTAEVRGIRTDRLMFQEEEARVIYLNGR